MNRLKYLIGFVFAVGVMLVGSQSASAAFVLVLDDPAIAGFQVIVVDDSPIGTATENVGASTHLDGTPTTPGSITVTASFGVWTVTVSTAFSKPLLLSAPTIHLSVVATSTGAGTLIVGATDTSFGPFTDPGIVSKLGGVSGGTVSVQGEADWLDQAGAPVSGNSEFSGSFGPDATEQDLTVAQGPFGVGALSGTVVVGGGPPVAPFSMTNYVTITHDAGVKASSVDHEVHLNPEPASLLVFAPVLGLLALRRRRKVS